MTLNTITGVVNSNRDISSPQSCHREARCLVLYLLPHLSGCCAKEWEGVKWLIMVNVDSERENQLSLRNNWLKVQDVRKISNRCTVLPL